MMIDAEYTPADAGPSPDRSAPTSTRPGRIEVITGVDRRRRWTLEQKQAIVEESLSGHATVVARKHGIGTGQLYQAAENRPSLKDSPRFCVLRRVFEA